MAKANRIVDGKRNANIPVDMSDHFYDHGNEYCRYLITDPRSDRKLKKDIIEEFKLGYVPWKNNFYDGTNSSSF